MAITTTVPDLFWKVCPDRHIKRPMKPIIIRLIKTIGVVSVTLLSLSPRNENLNFLVRIKFLNSFTYISK